MTNVETPYGQLLYDEIRRRTGYDVLSRALTYAEIQSLKKANVAGALALLFRVPLQLVAPAKPYDPAKLIDLWLDRRKKLRSQAAHRGPLPMAEVMIASSLPYDFGVRFLVMLYLSLGWVGVWIQRIWQARPTKPSITRAVLDSVPRVDPFRLGKVEIASDATQFGSQFLKRLMEMDATLPPMCILGNVDLEQLAVMDQKDLLKALFPVSEVVFPLYWDLDAAGCAELYLMDGWYQYNGTLELIESNVYIYGPYGTYGGLTQKLG
ncbi:MAG: hypothetical protein ACO1RA_21260 [Planctomycetaceae bacterium]